MPTYSADQIIGKTLIAKKPVKLYRSALDSATAVYTVDPGQSIGKVYSYLPTAPGRASVYWAFFDDNNRAYYTPHIQGNFDIKTLSDQGALTVNQQQEQQQEEQMSTTDKAFKLIRNIALYAAGAYLLKALISKK
jgi:hypothetical protein